MMRRGLVLIVDLIGVVIVVLGLAACASPTPPAATTAAPPPVAPSSTATAAGAGAGVAVLPKASAAALLDFQDRQRLAAVAAAQRGHWAEALWAWDVLLALNPGDAELQKRRQAAEQSATRLAQDKLQAARAAAQRNDSELATRLYLDVLALAPTRTEAADALRQIERERVRRQHLGQLSRNVLTRRGGGTDFSVGTGSGSGGGSGMGSSTGGGSTLATVSLASIQRPSSERNELEHASLLAAQGEIDSAIQLIRPLAQARNPDPAARQLLADLYFRQAEALAGSDRAATMAALEQCLQLDPAHTKAAARLKELRTAAATGTKAVPRKPTPAQSR